MRHNQSSLNLSDQHLGSTRDPVIHQPQSIDSSPQIAIPGSPSKSPPVVNSSISTNSGHLLDVFETVYCKDSELLKPEPRSGGQPIQLPPEEIKVMTEEAKGTSNKQISKGATYDERLLSNFSSRPALSSMYDSISAIHGAATHLRAHATSAAKVSRSAEHMAQAMRSSLDKAFSDLETCLSNFAELAQSAAEVAAQLGQHCSDEELKVKKAGLCPPDPVATGNVPSDNLRGSPHSSHENSLSKHTYNSASSSNPPFLFSQIMRPTTPSRITHSPTIPWPDYSIASIPEVEHDVQKNIPIPTALGHHSANKNTSPHITARRPQSIPPNHSRSAHRLVRIP